eukprot:TRINITY_DN6916_c0_g1_i2.p1 TRINITY_DN6916_c0_g1~~TRINITY_DN6916_c0_g1_i2.p1  ORF type:complete len:247 (+),score=20.68 TRINITY_DN6916_c0_g1_i2:91-831(+)
MKQSRIPSEHLVQTESFNTSEQKTGGRLIFGMKFRNMAKTNELVQDLHHVLSPIVGLIRTQCGLIQPIRTFLIKHEWHTYKKTYHKSSVEAILEEKKDGRSQDSSISTETFSVKEAELFGRFINDLSPMLVQRGVSITAVPAGSLQKDLDGSLWLSNPSISSSLYDDSEGLASSLTKTVDILEALANRQHSGMNWLKNVINYLESHPSLQKETLPPKIFHTRSSMNKANIRCHSLRQVLRATTCIV